MSIDPLGFALGVATGAALLWLFLALARPTGGRSSRSSSLPQVVRTFRVESRSGDRDLLAQLHKVSGDRRWFDRYISTYLESRDFADDVRAEIERLEGMGWVVSAVRPVDHIRDGLLMEVEARRELRDLAAARRKWR
jgi:hypothetical protein